jgi:hypothetical protein
VPWPSPGPRQERPDAGRSPGSRVTARCTPSQTSHVPAFGPVAAFPVRRKAMCIALAAYSCRDSHGIEGHPLTAFPIKPFARHRRDLHPRTASRPRTRWSIPAWGHRGKAGVASGWLLLRAERPHKKMAFGLESGRTRSRRCSERNLIGNAVRRVPVLQLRGCPCNCKRRARCISWRPRRYANSHWAGRCDMRGLGRPCIKL